ncbi:hypothetical protein Cob_v004746 [Colletotrichum orbiculare MAFF 240422]|uniref:Uncharacterized protein n=1 Tax=Colletotrichum orbiculare (strain 104-T / ATCC 96160 / CBS 514.97 / LARS 414 / MAFF 240422) TaxID=1213857 RepID=A0A484FYJ0_COLOR|nr:hypothetical protein Cob_v004746 [Colletotrichum orbiculare MAFF 240422]
MCTEALRSESSRITEPSNVPKRRLRLYRTASGVISQRHIANFIRTVAGLFILKISCTKQTPSILQTCMVSGSLRPDDDPAFGTEKAQRESHQDLASQRDRRWR